MQRKGNKPKIYNYISNKLHSIPKLKKNVKSNVVYSIPSIAVVALLLGVFFNLAFNNYCYATTETIGNDTASITLDTSRVEVNVTPGEIGYTSKDITVKVNNVDNYALTITAPAKLSKTGTTSAGSTDDNTSTAKTWGYAYGQSGNVESMSYTNFTGTTQTLESSNDNSINHTKTLAIAADFTNNPEAGHYTATVNLALTVTPKIATTYSITYNANGGTGASDPASQSETTYNSTHSFTIAAQGTLSKTGHKFLGWSESSTATTATYTVGSTINLTADNPSKVLYAVWEKLTTLNDITTMQEMTKQICNDSSSFVSATLSDSRDNNAYTVMKLGDGQCWMTQNLRIINRTITSADSDTTANFSIPASSLSNFSTSLVSAAYNSGSNVYGVYYSWCAATAGHCPTASDAVAQRSICPKNWRLPTRSEFDNLVNTSNGNMLNSSTYNFAVYAGSIENRAVTKNGTYGYWWSSTADGENDAYHLFARATDGWVRTNTMYSYYDNTGYSVRCVAR